MNRSLHGDEPSKHPSKSNLTQRETNYLYPSNLPGTVLNDDEIGQEADYSNQQRCSDMNLDSRNKRPKIEPQYSNMDVIEIPFPFLQRGAKLKLQKPILKKNMLVYPLLYISVPFRGSERPDNVRIQRHYHRKKSTTEKTLRSFRSRFYAGLRRFYSSFISCVTDNFTLDDLDSTQDVSDSKRRRDYRSRNLRHRY
uniref:Uncharacterized protein n=1 Tax=Octopus bimaculoides TaxID=37653 RepID=A0A0L8GWB1_OCTBM